MSKYLLDTAVFLWAADNPENLSKEAGTILVDAGKNILLSSVSVWEMAIKFSLGKLLLSMIPEKMVYEHAAMMKFLPLMITHAHSLQVAQLPFHHKDPFDRLLIAQALVEEIPIITPDSHFKKYGVEVIW